MRNFTLIECLYVTPSALRVIKAHKVKSKKAYERAAKNLEGILLTSSDHIPTSTYILLIDQYSMAYDKYWAEINELVNRNTFVSDVTC
jgi:hypothetical protein